MEVLRCQTPAMLHKEIWAHLLAYNLVRKVMAQAAMEAQLNPRQISFMGTVQTLNTFRDPLLGATPEVTSGGGWTPDATGDRPSG
jgi:hypothetical protein